MLTLSESYWAELSGIPGVGGVLPSSDVAGPGELLSPQADRLAFADICTWPNLVTLAGYAAGLIWLAGGSPIWALLSIIADELDGPIARNLGQTSEYGADLDFGVDLCLAALMGARLGNYWILPASLAGQIFFRHQDFSPPVGSVRAALMVYGLTQGI